MIVIEDILGRCAPLLGVDAARAAAAQLLRARPGDAVRPAGPPRRAARGDLGASCIERSDFDRRAAEIAAFNAAHPHTKRGLAITPVKFGISFNLTAFNQAGALVHVYKDGSVLINHGGVEMGQGLHTKMLQVAATALGVPLSLVRLAPTRTDKVPNTSATAASSGADINGGAVKNACEQIRERLAVVAAGQLGIHPDDVRFVDGVVTGIGFHDRQLAWADLVHDAYFQRVQLWAAGFYRTAGLHWDAERMQGEPFKYFAYGAAVGRGRGRRVHRRLPGAARRHRPRRRRQPVAAGRPRPDRGRLRAGRRLADPGGAALGHQRRPEPRPAEHPGGEHLQDPELLRDAGRVQRAPVRAGHRVRRRLRLEGGRRAAADAGVQRPRGAARRRSRRSAPPGTSVELGCPSTPEAVYWAIQAATGRR